MTYAKEVSKFLHYKNQVHQYLRLCWHLEQNDAS